MIPTIFFTALAFTVIAFVCAALNMVGMMGRPGAGLERDRFSSGFKRHALLGGAASLGMMTTIGTAVWWLVDTYATKS